VTIRDLPDYTREMVLRHVGGYIGMEELAARLGSCVPGNMPGNLVLMEQFDTELTDFRDTSTGNATAERCSRQKFSGDWSVKLTPDNVGAYYSGRIRRRLHFPGLKKYGLFTRLGWDTDLCYWTVGITFWTGSRKVEVAIRYDYREETLAVLISPPEYKDVATGLTLGRSDVLWFPLLVTFDLTAEAYLKLYFAGTEYTVSSYSLKAADDTTDPYCQIAVFSASNAPAQSFVSYVDAVVLTSDVE